MHIKFHLSKTGFRLIIIGKSKFAILIKIKIEEKMNKINFYIHFTCKI
jgi:hypothetical protein